jgi:hypothetical protein
MRTLAATLVVLVSGLAFGGETAVKGYLSCQSLPNEDTIYDSSTWDGAGGDQERAFLQYLQTKYGYTGRTTCSVEYKATTTIAHMQQSHNAMVAQWRSQGKKIVETGWTYNGAPALTGPAPDGPVASAAAKPQTRVPDPDDQPMPAKKSVTPPAAAAHTAPAAAPAAATAPETYVFCYSMGSPYRGTARSHYYITSVFASSNAHADGPFGVYLHKQHPEEDNHAQCTSPGPMSTAENSRRTNIESMHKLFPERDVVELNWKPTT